RRHDRRPSRCLAFGTYDPAFAGKGVQNVLTGAARRQREGTTARRGTPRCGPGFRPAGRRAGTPFFPLLFSAPILGHTGGCPQSGKGKVDGKRRRAPCPKPTSTA